MSDPKKIGALKKQIGKLEDDLRLVIEECARVSHHSESEIRQALEDRGWLTSTPPLVLPEECDRKLRHLDNQITKLKKELKNEEEKK